MTVDPSKMYYSLSTARKAANHHQEEGVFRVRDVLAKCDTEEKIKPGLSKTGLIRLRSD